MKFLKSKALSFILVAILIFTTACNKNNSSENKNSKNSNEKEKVSQEIIIGENSDYGGYDIFTCSPARSADFKRPSQLGSPGLGDRGASWSERSTWSIRRSSRVVARLACSMSQSAATRRSGSLVSTLRATAARTVIRPMPWETRSCRSRAIVNRSVVTAAAICWDRSAVTMVRSRSAGRARPTKSG